MARSSEPLPGRFHPPGAPAEAAPFRLIDQQEVRVNGVKVVNIERTPELYADLQPTFATFFDRVDVIGVSDPLFNAPYILEKGQLEHDVFQEPVVKRLLYVDQWGERRAIFAMVNTHPHARGEHSLATCKIMKDERCAIGAPPSKVQVIAALTHDVGQPGYSHHGEAAFDWSKRQNWHDERRKELLEAPSPYGLADLLERHGLSADEVLAAYDDPVLDVERPDLCADRIEYLLRDGMTHGDIEPFEARLLLDDVTITTTDQMEMFCPLPEEQAFMTPERFAELQRLSKDSQRHVWYCKSTAGAEAYYRLMEILNSVYTGAEMGTIKMYTSRLLRLGMERGYLTADMIKTETDDRILLRLARATYSNPGDEEFCQHYNFLKLLGMPRPRPEVEAFILEHRQEVEELQTPDTGTTKKRWVDPFVKRWLERQDTHEMVPVIRRLSYFKRLGYQVQGDHGALSAVSERLSLPQPTHRPVVPEIPGVLQFANRPEHSS